jgi:hypothetical protein
MIVESSCFTDNAFNNAIDSFDLPERDFNLTVVQNTVDMTTNHFYKILQWLQPLPSEFIFPSIEKFERPWPGFIAPQGAENLLEIISNTETFVQRKRFFKQPLLLVGQIEPSTQKEPSFSSDQFPFLSTLTKELPTPYFIDCVIQMTDQMKFVEDDFGVLAEGLNTGSESFPHIHADHLDRATECRPGCFKKGIKRYGLVAIRNSYDSASFKVNHNSVHVIHSAKTNLVYTKPTDILHRTTISVISLQHGVFNSGGLVPGYTMLIRCGSDRLIHAFFKNHSLKTPGKAGSAINEWKPLAAYSAAVTVYPTPEKPEKYIPIEDRLITVQSYGPVLDAGNNLTATITDGAMLIIRYYTYNNGHFFLLEFGIKGIKRKTIDSNNGIEYFLCSWHFIFLLTLWVNEKDRSRTSRMPTTLNTSFHT